MLELSNAIAEFLSYIHREKGCTLYTQTQYERELNQMKEFFEKRKKYVWVSELTLRDLRQFISSLPPFLKTNTVRRKIIVIRSFFKYLYEMGYIQENPALFLRCPRKEKVMPEFLTPDELKKLLEAPFSYAGPRRRAERDHLVLKILAYTGLRRNEFCYLIWEDVDLEGGWIRVRKGKGKKERYIPIHPELLKSLKKYHDEILPEPKDPLFKSIRDKRIAPRTVEHIFRRAKKASGLKKEVTLHSLRHTFASLLLQCGADIVSLKELLGHEDISSTAIYLHVTPKKLRDAISHFPNLD